jgi:dolichol-phosphate mannosyltransferase
METIELSVLIPAYLEEENLRLILPRLMRSLDGLKTSFEVIVIDTMQPKDNTAEACKENGAHYINREGGNSYGDAVRTGIKKANGKYVIFMDSDGSHSPEFIPNLFDNRNNYDVVIASRYVKGGGSDNTFALKLMSLMVNMSFSFIFRLGCKDVSNSFKLYRNDMLKGLRLTSDNFEIIEEILIRLKRAKRGLKVLEVPFYFKERMFGHTKRNLFVFIFSYLFVIIKLLLIR